jgi:hypothetical protein
MTPLDLVLSLLKGVKRSGAAYVALCPAHDDHTPSLSVSEGEDARVLLHCHRECSPEAIVAALRLTMRDLFPSNSNCSAPLKAVSTTRIPPDAQLVESYEYTNERGGLLFYRDRFEWMEGGRRHKAVLPRQIDGTRRGKAPVPYRLCEVVSAIARGEVILLCEGEKPVDALRAHGFIATTTGSAASWESGFAEHFRRARIVLWPDADDPGEAYIARDAEDLCGLAEELRVLRFAGKPSGWDAADYFEEGGSDEQLDKLLADVPVWHRRELSVDVGDARGESLTHIRDLLAEPDDAVSWIVEEILPAGGLSVLAGKPKGGKSTLGRAIALRVSRGESVLGCRTTAGPVVYIGLEDPRRVTKAHLRQLGAEATDDLYVWTGNRPEHAVAWLRDVLDTVDPVLVVIDTLQHLLGVSDLNDYARVFNALRPVLALVRPRRAHLLLIHHAGKGERTDFDAILGSTAILGTVDTALLIRRRDDGTRTLATRQRTGDDVPESILLLDERHEPKLSGTRAEHDAELAQARVYDWLSRQSEPTTRAEVLSGVDGDANANTPALYALVKAERVAKTGRGVKGDPFRYACIPHVPHAGMQEPSGNAQ